MRQIKFENWGDVDATLYFTLITKFLEPEKKISNVSI